VVVTAQSADLARWARLAMPVTGVVGTAVFFLVVFSPNLPMYGDSLSDWGRWAPTHQSAARDAVAILALAYLLYMVFAVYLATLVRRSDPSTATLVQVATVAIAVKYAIEMMQIAVLAVPETGDSKDFGGSMAQLGSVLSGLSLVPFAVFLVAVGVAALMSRAVPAWLAWFTLAVAAIHIFAIALGLTGVSASPVLVVFGFVWFASIPAWPLVTSAALLISALRRPGTDLRAATAS
jgi:hypothetical protein